MEVSMKKVVINALMVLSLALVMLLAGCDSSGEKVTLKVLHYIDATSAGYADDVAIWDKFIAANPNVTLEKEELFNEPFHQKTEAYIASGNYPDVMYMWPSGRSASLHTKGVMRDLSTLLADELGNFSAAAIDPTKQSGGILAMIPMNVTYTNYMYANVKLLADNGLTVPTTYEELKAMVPVLKAKGIQTVLMANKDTWPMQSCLFSTVSGRLAGDKFIDDVKAGTAKFTDEAFVKALSFIETMYKDGVLSRDTIQLGYGEVPALFATGKAAFLIDGDWRVGDFLTNKDSGTALIDPALQATDFEFITFPTIPGEVNPGLVSAIGGTGFGITKAVEAGTAKEVAAVKLIKHLYSEETMKTRLASGAFVPSRKGVVVETLEPLMQKNVKFKEGVAGISSVLDGVLDGDNAPIVNILNTGLQEIGLGKKTPAQVAEEMQAKVVVVQ
jgi:raffinose/stachyose/melibiose transport system substrate-binding protein